MMTQSFENEPIEVSIWYGELFILVAKIDLILEIKRTIAMKRLNFVLH